ncbi:MAG TPA: hypothetical protein VFU94_01405 [Conexibacter sp.]|nr:hypothetical protein [Conexibacter sp.]
MSADPRRLRRGEIVAALGAIALLVVMFALNWYCVGPVSRDGWEAHAVLRWLMLLTILGGLALAVLTATQRTVAVPVTVAVIVTALAALLTLLLAIRVILDPPGPDAVSVRVGAWLGLLSSAAILLGACWSMRDEGTKPAAAPPPAPAPPAPPAS